MRCLLDRLLVASGVLAAIVIAGACWAQSTPPTPPGTPGTPGSPGGPGGPGNPASPGQPSSDPKKQEEPPFRFKQAFDAVIRRLDSKDWEEQRRHLARREIQNALGDEHMQKAKDLTRAMTNIEALSANNHMDKQMLLVQIIGFKTKERAEEYLDLVHSVTRARLNKEASRNEEYAVEVREERLQILGPDKSKRLVMETKKGPRAGQVAVDRYITGSIFVEVTTVVQEAKKSVDIVICETVFREAKAL